MIPKHTCIRQMGEDWDWTIEFDRFSIESNFMLKSAEEARAEISVIAHQLGVELGDIEVDSWVEEDVEEIRGS